MTDTTPQAPAPREHKPPAACKNGHTLTPDIICYPKAGSAKWRCRACMRISYRKCYKKKRDAWLAAGWIPFKFRAKPKRKEVCSKGHPWTDETTYVTPKTQNRQCRICRKVRMSTRIAQLAAYRALLAAQAASSDGSQVSGT